MNSPLDSLKRSATLERSISVRVPGSTSNLGPGFDTLGLALSLYNTVTFDVLTSNDPAVPLVSVFGEGTGSLPCDGTNHIYRILRDQLSENPELLSRVRLRVECSVPVGSGLGSSGTATLAALWGASQLVGRVRDNIQLLADATSIEGHPDNVSPSLLGGFTISAMNAGQREVLVQKMSWPSHWQAMFVVPNRQLSTREARAVLPKAVPFQDAVHNVQRVSLLLAAVASANEDLLRNAFDDKLHEPYRQHLIPELVDLRRALRGSNALGCTLSGAGPTVMVMFSKRHRNEIETLVENWAAAQESVPRVLNLSVDQEGLKPLAGANE